MLFAGRVVTYKGDGRPHVVDHDVRFVEVDELPSFANEIEREAH